jgi:hypothetical protein
MNFKKMSLTLSGMPDRQKKRQSKHSAYPFIPCHGARVALQRCSILRAGMQRVSQPGQRYSSIEPEVNMRDVFNRFNNPLDIHIANQRQRQAEQRHDACK